MSDSMVAAVSFLGVICFFVSLFSFAWALDQYCYGRKTIGEVLAWALLWPLFGVIIFCKGAWRSLRKVWRDE